MNSKAGRFFILAMSILMALIACNSGGTKEAAATDSTTIAKTDTVQHGTQGATLDALKTDPNLYKLIKDTLGIRIIESTYKPDDSSSMHSFNDHAVYVIDGGSISFIDKNGTKDTREFKTGTSIIEPAVTHAMKNVGKTTCKILIVEVNRPMGIVHNDAAMDPIKVAPELYKLKMDTLGIRILETTYKPGQSSAMHSHPDNAMYVIEGGTSEITLKDGTKQTSELKKGMSRINAGGTHSVKNIGKTTTKVLLVEVDRPEK